MTCPYCNSEMTQGFVQSARQIFFSTKKHRFHFLAREGEQILTKHSWTAPTCKALCCTQCKKVILDYSDAEQI